MASYLEGQGDLVSRLLNPITHIVALVIPFNDRNLVKGQVRKDG